jgi:hypothetical protein
VRKSALARGEFEIPNLAEALAYEWQSALTKLKHRKSMSKSARFPLPSPEEMGLYRKWVKN